MASIALQHELVLCVAPISNRVKAQPAKTEAELFSSSRSLMKLFLSPQAGTRSIKTSRLGTALAQIACFSKNPPQPAVAGRMGLMGQISASHRWVGGYLLDAWWVLLESDGAAARMARAASSRRVVNCWPTSPPRR